MLGDKYQIFYDAKTGQVAYVHFVNVIMGIPVIPENNVHAVDVVPAEEATFVYPIDETFDNLLYNPITKSFTVKPKVVCSVSPEPGTVSANGSDFYTISFDIQDTEGNSYEWGSMKVKDENFIAQVSSDSILYSEPHVVKVRSFVPGTAKIRLKEEWDGKSTLDSGNAFTRYGRINVELKFKNPTGW